MTRKSNKKLTAILIGLLFLMAITVVGIYTQGFTLLEEGETVWIPDYGTVACKETRLECSPGLCSDTNPEFGQIDQKGNTELHCGAPTISDANYYKGCDIFLRSSGFSFALLDFSKLQICDQDKSCQGISNLPETSKFGKTARKVELRAGQYLKINPNLAKYEYHIVAPVYGLAIEGAVKPKYADRCNIAALLNDKQIATLKNSPDYAKTINAGEISPQNFPVVFIVGYKASYKDQRVIERNGKSWFIEDIGLRCKIEKDTNDRNIVTDTCVSDNSIECFPNIGNCDKDGKIRTENNPENKACVPGTLIGSSTARTAINADKACRLKCNSAGVPVNYDCIDIPKCSDGKVLGPDYECIDSTKLTEQEICESKGGRFIETKDEKGNVSYSCDYSGPDLFYVYLAIGAFAAVIGMLLIKIQMNGGTKRSKRRRRKK